MAGTGFVNYTEWTDVPTLHKNLSQPPSGDHDPALLGVEEELLQHYKDFAYFCNHDAVDNPDKGKRFYDLEEAAYFDLMGSVERPGFGPHYDLITPYLADANLRVKDLEVIAITPTFGYGTAYQHYWGKAADGNDFDFTYRTTSIMRKKGGVWKYVHEHYSFPCVMATGKADFTSGLKIAENVKLST